MRPQSIRACFFRMRSLGCSFRHISDALGVSQRQLYRWQRTPLLMTRPLDRRHLRRRTSSEIGDAVISRVIRHNVATLGDIRDDLRRNHSVIISKHPISRLLRERKWTRKRGAKAYVEADASRCAEFSRSIATVLSSGTLALDECASSTTASTTPGALEAPELWSGDLAIVSGPTRSCCALGTAGTCAGALSRGPSPLSAFRNS
jgi:transposase